MTRHSAFSRFKVTHSASSLLNLEDICLYLDKYAQADCGLVSSSTWIWQFLSLQPERSTWHAKPIAVHYTYTYTKYRCSQYLINLLKQEERYVLRLEFIVRPHNQQSVQDIVPVITFFAIYYMLQDLITMFVQILCHHINVSRKWTRGIFVILLSVLCFGVSLLYVYIVQQSVVTMYLCFN